MRTSAVLTLALATACADGASDNTSQVTGPNGDVGDDGIAMVVNENTASTLSAVASVTLAESGTVHLEFWSDDSVALRTLETPAGTELDLDVVGMRAETTYTLQAVATLPDGTELRSETWGFVSGSLPADLPDMWVVSGSEADPAITLLGPTSGDSGGPGGGGAGDDFPYLVGVDRSGEVVWYFDSDDLGGGIDHAGELLDDGTLQILGSDAVQGLTAGTDLAWSVPTGQAGTTHHDAVTLPDGHVVVLVQESETHNVPSLGGSVTLVGDVLHELDEGGDVVWSWSTFDHLDTTRFPGSLSQGTARGSSGYDWSHTNAISYVAAQDALLVSFRHQNQVALIDRESSEILWTLGDDGDFDLAGSGEWFTSQHAVTMPAADEVLLYDNGNEKSDPESRSVRYRIDTDTWTARQIWSWETDLFTENVGDSDALDDGRVLVTAGGQRTSGDARIAEIDADGDVVWELNVGDDLTVYRSERVDWLSAVD